MSTAATTIPNAEKKPWLIYSSTEEDIVLIDVPGSIARHSTRCLLSVKPQSVPWELPEPKHGKAVFSQELLDTHTRLKSNLYRALEDIGRNYNGSWCLPRQWAEPVQRNHDFIPATLKSNLSLLGSFTTAEGNDWLDLTLEGLGPLEVSDVYNKIAQNSSLDTLPIRIRVLSEEDVFEIPAGASFLLADIQESLAAFSSYAKAVDLFDFVLLDPPWPNRSVSRAQHSYDTLYDSRELFSIPLKKHVRENGLIGVWVTNKARWRNLLLNELFPQWGVEYAGEWVWLKTTKSGEPIFNLESVMRKPYEILIFGRKKGMGCKRGNIKDEVSERGSVPEGVESGRQISSKTLVGVPDYHSRKPCVKDLLEPYLPEQYKACEIFGRCLVDGWLTWGNEAVKYNSCRYWK